MNFRATNLLSCLSVVTSFTFFPKNRALLPIFPIFWCLSSIAQWLWQRQTKKFWEEPNVWGIRGKAGARNMDQNKNDAKRKYVIDHKIIDNVPWNLTKNNNINHKAKNYIKNFLLWYCVTSIYSLLLCIGANAAHQQHKINISNLTISKWIWKTKAKY